ncbi:MAG: hypothetical protein L3J43_09020 [Sulfurovum sp.]|nr:hypothetical protein [Sulfurovum sp.]
MKCIMILRLLAFPHSPIEGSLKIFIYTTSLLMMCYLPASSIRGLRGMDSPSESSIA